ncbi:hypothetical protein L6164_013137 [Bauhinia variegata]|uniref:Uncharacterized protein n=1 Tax=Bauhinia variegata TaxID=167791 RepID=A0ACB9PHM4_BAUVA|nr:hypothetical protein L6164_013137 [Bauhinia variegata]
MNVIKYGFRMLVFGNNSYSSSIQTRIFCTVQSKFPTSDSLNISGKFALFLDDCSDVLTLKKLHARIFVSGFENNSFLATKLLKCYAKFGLLSEPRWIFYKIISRNHSLWNPIFVGYFSAGHYGEVLIRYLDLKQQKICLDGSAITFSLKSCIELGSLEFGRGIHVDAFKFNLNADCFVGSSLIGLYSKHGKMEEASRAYNEITNKDVVACTSIITAYAQCRDLCAYEAFRIAYGMQKEQLLPNRVTLVSLLQAATHLGTLKEGRAIHGYSIRKGIGISDEIFETSLMDMYQKCGDPQTAAFIFGKMHTRTIGSWNTMIVGYLHTGHALEAFDLFCQMMQENISPDLVTLANAILSCATLNYLCQGKSIHGCMVRMGAELDLVETTALVDLYSKFDVTKARKIFDSSGDKDTILFDVMMAGYLQHNLSREAVQIFNEMVKVGVRPSLGSLLNILSAVSSLKDAQQVRSVHGYVLRYGYVMNMEIANQIIYAYAKCGSIHCAKKVFDRIRHRDLVTWTSMMKGYIHHGHIEEAISLFRLLQKENLNLDSVTLISLLQALSQLGCLSSIKEVHCHIYRVFHGREASITNFLITAYAKYGRLEMAKFLFEQMTERCLTSWNAMISAYGMHGHSKEVLKLFDQMKSAKIVPDEITFTSILSACSHSGLIEEGLQAFRTMVKEYCIVPCEVHYSCIVDLLSRAGRLKDAYDLTKCMPSKHSSSALVALLSACRLYGDTEMGEVIGKQILKLEPDNSSSYYLVSNLYAERGKWDEVASIRTKTRERGIKRTTGYSSIELDEYCAKCE